METIYIMIYSILSGSVFPDNCYFCLMFPKWLLPIMNSTSIYFRNPVSLHPRVNVRAHPAIPAAHHQPDGPAARVAAHAHAALADQGDGQRPGHLRRPAAARRPALSPQHAGRTWRTPAHDVRIHDWPRGKNLVNLPQKSLKSGYK